MEGRRNGNEKGICRNNGNQRRHGVANARCSAVGGQIVTKEWWRTAGSRFDLHCSDAVKREAGKGDAEAAQRRLDALEGIPELATSMESLLLAKALIDGKAVPKEYPDDALHIAIAAVSQMDFLVSWNFKHITNAQTIPLVKRICESVGCKCPEICTPYQLQPEGGLE